MIPISVSKRVYSPKAVALRKELHKKRMANGGSLNKPAVDSKPFPGVKNSAIL